MLCRKGGEGGATVGFDRGRGLPTGAEKRGCIIAEILLDDR